MCFESASVSYTLERGWQQIEWDTSVRREVVQTDIFKFEFPELILSKWYVGREGDTELVLHSERVV